MAELKESYEKIEYEIKKIGDIKDIVNDREKLLKILTYDGDRHIVAMFYEMLNRAVEQGDISKEELEANIRSGWFANATIHLKDYLFNREPYSSEIGNKINYACLLRDSESQIAMFTRPEIVGAIAGTLPDPGRELSYCQSSFYSWNIEAKLRLVQEVLKAGNREKALMLMEDITLRLERERRYEEELEENRER